MPAVHTDMKMKKSEDEKSLQEYSENKVLSNSLPPASLFPPSSWILCKRHFFCEKVESADEFS